jgi:hypothetical protein
MIELIKIMRKNGHLQWVDDPWEQNKLFLLSLINTGGLPRGLEYVLCEMETYATTFKLKLNQMTVDVIEAANTK